MDAQSGGTLKATIEDIVGCDNIKEMEDMGKHTSFKVGGPARYFITPGSAQELEAVLLICKEVELPVCVMGNGSNLLVKSDGFDGAVIQIGGRYTDYSVEGDTITVEAGMPLARLAKIAADHGLTGLEFASGIPGTVGGAVTMNAGAYGGEIADVIESVIVVDEDGDGFSLPVKKLELGYRTSAVMTNHYIVLEATFKLKYDAKDSIFERMEEFTRRRREKQPLEYPSAGSTFKRPEGYFAGKLIEDAGLRGYQVGGAQVSEKHCGFVINRDHATVDDILALMDDVIRKVKETSGVTLEPEVRIIG